MEDSLQKAVTAIIQNFDDPGRNGLQDTPARVAKAYREMFSGYDVDILSLLKSFDEKYNGMVVQKNVEFYSTCEHHLLPFTGRAHIAYIPTGQRVLGASKLVRLLEAYAKRMSIQERIAQSVVDALMKHVDPKPIGAGCVIEAKHLCMMCRGVRNSKSSMVTSVYAGSFLNDIKTRDEFLQLIRT